MKLYKYLMIMLSLCGMAFSDNIQSYDLPSRELVLAKSYTTSDGIITSRTFFPDIEKNFQIAILPLDKFSITLKSIDVAKHFERYGYKLSYKHPSVEVIFQTDMRYKDEGEFIKKQYIDFYKNNDIQIEKILLRPTAPVPKLSKPISIKLSKKIHNNKGQILVQYKGKNTTLNTSFYYEVIGHISVYQASQNISSNQNLTNELIKPIKLNLDMTKGQYMDKQNINSVSAKSYIAKDSIIMKNKLKGRILVHKGEIIMAKINNQGIEIETSLIAKQSGEKGEIINAQNKDSKRIIRVKITGENKGEVI